MNRALAESPFVYVRIISAILVVLWAAIAGEAIHQRYVRAPQASWSPKLKPPILPETKAGLDRVLPAISLRRMGLKQALTTLQRISGANIMVQWDNVARERITPDTPVDVELFNVTADVALRSILRNADPELDYGVEPDGLIVVTTQFYGAPSSLVVYDLRALTPEPAPPSANQMTGGGIGAGSAGTSSAFGPVPPGHEGLADTIKYLVHGRQIAAWGGRLIVFEPPRTQRRVRDILDKLSKVQDARRAPSEKKP
ncbi:MAG: hypothetical protein JWP03_2211 [Phycisphaerales bacterium]|nr:hypothetical protein [Phycisphaerales bacterium]